MSNSEASESIHHITSWMSNPEIESRTENAVSILNVLIEGLCNRIKEQDEKIEHLEITNKNLLEDIMELTGKA